MLDMLLTFITVVEQHSLSRASKHLNLSQPALSRKIMRLEETLDVQLFRRAGRRLELTSAGQRVYEHAVEMAHLQRKLELSLQPYRSPQKHSITIGASLTTLQSTLPDLLALMTSRLPMLELRAVTGKTHEIVSLVKDKKADLGLVATRIEQPEIDCIPLFDDHLCLVLPAGHSALDKTVATIHDLNGMPMLLFSRGTWYRILMDELFQRFAVFPEITMEIDSFEAIIRLVSTLRTATLLPKSYLRQAIIDNNELHIIEMKELAAAVRTTSLIFHRSSALPQEVIRLLRDASEHWSDYSATLE